MRKPFSRSSSPRGSSPNNSPPRTHHLPRLQLPNLQHMPRMAHLSHQHPTSAASDTHRISPDPAELQKTAYSPASAHSNNTSRRSDSLWTARPTTWELHEGQEVSSVRSLLEALIKHTPRFRYRFIIVRLDEHVAEIGCCSSRRELPGSRYAPRCNFRLVLERHAAVFIVTEWQPRHSCTASYRLRESHNFLTETFLAHTLDTDDTRIPSRPRCNKSLSDVLRAAEAHEHNNAPFFTAEQLLSTDRPRTPPPPARRGIRRPRAASFHSMSDFVGSRRLDPGAWRYARGEHGSLDDLRRARTLAKRRSASAMEDLRIVLADAARDGFVEFASSVHPSWAEHGDTSAYTELGGPTSMTPSSSATRRGFLMQRRES